MTPEEKAREVVSKWLENEFPDPPFTNFGELVGCTEYDIFSLEKLIAQALAQPTFTEEDLTTAANSYAQSKANNQGKSMFRLYGFYAGARWALAKIKGEKK